MKQAPTSTERLAEVLNEVEILVEALIAQRHSRIFDVKRHRNTLTDSDL